MRPSGRAPDQLREVRLTRRYIKHPEGSVLVEFGDTRVLCNASVEERVPQIREAQRQRLLGRLDDLGVKADTERLEQELALIAQKGDIAEEIDRLDLHLEEVERVLGRDEAVGRRLDFLMQELNREANTIASKSSDVGLTQTSVDIKVLIEQIREQIQNIE